MGTDHLQTGLPFAFSAPDSESAQPTCRAISLEELTGGGTVTVLAASAEDIGSGAAGLVMASLDDDRRVDLFTLTSGAGDHEAAWMACRGESSRHPNHLTLHRSTQRSLVEQVVRAADQVIGHRKGASAGNLFVAAMPVPSARHRFLDLVARRVGATHRDLPCWHFAAGRDRYPGAAHLLRTDAFVRTFDIRPWAAHCRRQLPELFWRDTDVSALSSVAARDVAGA